MRVRRPAESEPRQLDSLQRAATVELVENVEGHGAEPRLAQVERGGLGVLAEATV